MNSDLCIYLNCFSSCILEEDDFVSVSFKPDYDLAYVWTEILKFLSQIEQVKFDLLRVYIYIYKQYSFVFKVDAIHEHKLEDMPTLLFSGSYLNTILV